MYIDGKWIKTDSILTVFNPATSERIGEVCLVDKQQAENAIQVAKKAFVSWSQKTAAERSSYLKAIADKIEERKEQFAELITKEMGKSIHNARYEVQSAIDYFHWYAEEARRVYGDTIPSSEPSKRIMTIKQPVGVVGAITPWNFPLSMAARKFAPALAAGCTIILKPAPEAPMSAVELFKVFDEVKLPKGVVNLLLGEPEEIASALMESRDVRKITFTGSTEVGKILIRQSADTVKKVSMELGGHAPFIVFDDADLELAVEGLIKSKFASTGQQCVCPNRIYVHESIFNEFAEHLKKKVSSLKVGNGLDESNDIGAMVSESGLAKVHEHVTDAVRKGASVLCGGSRLEDGEYKNGIFYAPTVLADVNEDMIIVKEETFGPAIPLIRFSSEEEVVEKANDTEYGLVSYFYTNDLGRMYRMSEQLEYGMVGVNDPAPFVVQAPFGGVKESGLGKEGGYQGLEEYLETKFVSVKFS
ncbi:NAD-dependent succinate-semialdehyde dehydrogenase [Pueribacillus sp. YX66]|uniref:NAD-dependent succinate-semialdehyde dehydrogenase n=1 Tax=Pueribacillus sp. YX66 TaxID=3229242 RepID=UPI00358D2BD8